MGNEVSPVTPMNAIPPDILEMLGPPPLLSTEDEKLYFAFIAKLAQPIASPDIITWMLIKDLADHRLEIARYRRLKSLLIERAAEQERLRLGDQAPAADEPHKRNFDEVRASFRVAAREIYGNDPRFEEARQEELRKIRASNAEEREAREREFKSRSIEEPQARPPTDDDFADGFDNWIGKVERIDVLLRAEEQRFSDARRETERHIFGFGRLLRDDLDRQIDGEVVNETPRLVRQGQQQ